MTYYSTANSPEAVKQAVFNAIQAIHAAGITLADKAHALTILAEIATQMKDDGEANTRNWQEVVNDWGE